MNTHTPTAARGSPAQRGQADLRKDNETLRDALQRLAGARIIEDAVRTIEIIREVSRQVDDPETELGLHGLDRLLTRCLLDPAGDAVADRPAEPHDRGHHLWQVNAAVYSSNDGDTTTTTGHLPTFYVQASSHDHAHTLATAIIHARTRPGEGTVSVDISRTPAANPDGNQSRHPGERPPPHV